MGPTGTDKTGQVHEAAVSVQALTSCAHHGRILSISSIKECVKPVVVAHAFNPSKERICEWYDQRDVTLF